MPRLAKRLLALSAALTTTGAAPPYTARIDPLAMPKTSLSASDLRIARPLPALFDQQMRFDFRHAVINKEKTGATLKLPDPPTATKQGVQLNLFAWGLVFTPDAYSALHLVYSSTNNLASADFRSDAFELPKRKAVDLTWQGYFEPHNIPIQVRLSFGDGREIGAVTFSKGQVFAGDDASGTPIAGYAGWDKVVLVPHRLIIRADLVKRVYTVRFEQGDQTATSGEIAFPAAAGTIPAGPQQVTAQLTSPKLYGLYYYDLAQVTLSGEPG